MPVILQFSYATDMYRKIELTYLSHIYHISKKNNSSLTSLKKDEIVLTGVLLFVKKSVIYRWLFL